MHPQPDFSNTTAVVTGAGSGIGRAAAIALAEHGANVLGIGRRLEPLEDTARSHSRIRAASLDLRDPDAPRQAIETAIRHWERVDVLVNNAGVTAMTPLAQVTPDKMAELIGLNVSAPTLLAQASLPHLRESHGSIVNISSTYGHRPIPGASIYSASKAAIEQLTRCWALELASDGVRVNAVAPGPTESGALHAAGLATSVIEQIKQEEANRIPLGRRGCPDEVAAWVLHLADPDATWLTGQILTIDGGLELT